MDTSNPIVPSDRRTLMEILDAQKLRRRQDLRYLGDVAQTAQRLYLPVTVPLIEDLGEVRRIYEEFRKHIPQVPRIKDEKVPEVVHVVYQSVPVSGVLNMDGLPLHPPSVNNDQGKVSVQRTMGGSPHAPLGLSEITAVFGEEILQRKHVYTNGTWKGFMNRLEKQMGRKTVSVREAYSKELGVKIGSKYLVNKLKQLFPRSKSDWPALDEDLDVMLKKLKITASSSAGAPYWRNKSECLPEVLDTGLPLVVKAIKEGRLSQLWKENPEFFLCEVKNKLDRYDITELGAKTRPYCAIPAHWALLFSVLTQRFQSTLDTFDKNDKSVNAYGFCGAKGGFKRFYEWMLRADKRGRVTVYGDDSCLVIKRGGKLVRVDPDFQQMDGSLDKEDMDLTVDWVLSCLADEDGGTLPEFWKVVGQQWKEMASDPIFVLDGKQVYRKNKPNGLLSGVPGTTLFDTVKSALMWDLFLDVCQNKGLDPTLESVAVPFMAKYGLVVKPGTWEPAEIPKARPGVLMTEHKFLGVQILVEEYKGELVFVPTIPEEDMLEMMVVQKDNPYAKTASAITKKRTLYDRMRGLMITFGFTNERAMSAIHHVVNNLDPVAILMVSNLGTGERPDHILLEDYAYPDSSGFPTRDFCLGLYGGTERDEDWIQLFPTLAPLLESLRGERREVELALTKGPVKQVVMCTVETQTEGLFEDPEFGVLALMPKVGTKPFEREEPHPRSSIVNRMGDSTAKVVPTLGEALTKHLQEVDITQVGTICSKFQISSSLLVREAERYGLYLTGVAPGDLVSLTPIQSPFATVQSEITAKAAERADVISKGVAGRLRVKKEVTQAEPNFIIKTAPEALTVDPDLIEALRLSGRCNSIKTTEGPLAIDALCKAVVQCRGTYGPLITALRWRTVEVLTNTPNPVAHGLEVKWRRDGVTDSDWEIAAFCRSANKKLAQGYIVKSILSTLGVGVKTDRYSTRSVPRNDEIMDSWADEVEAEEEAEKWGDPILIPIKPAVELTEEQYITLEKLLERLAEDDSALRMMIKLSDLLLRSGTTLDKVVNTLQKVAKRMNELHRSPSPSSSDETPQSPEPTSDSGLSSPVVNSPKRSVRARAGPLKRAKLNKKVGERKKRRHAELQQFKLDHYSATTSSS